MKNQLKPANITKNKKVADTQRLALDDDFLFAEKQNYRKLQKTNQLIRADSELNSDANLLTDQSEVIVTEDDLLGQNSGPRFEFKGGKHQLQFFDDHAVNKKGGIDIFDSQPFDLSNSKTTLYQNQTSQIKPEYKPTNLSKPPANYAVNISDECYNKNSVKIEVDTPETAFKKTKENMTLGESDIDIFMS